MLNKHVPYKLALCAKILYCHFIKRHRGWYTRQKGYNEGGH